MKTKISNWTIFVVPSEQLVQHINNLKSYADMPLAFIAIRSRKVEPKDNYKPIPFDKGFLVDDDLNYIKSLNLSGGILSVDAKDTKGEENTTLLTLEDLDWLYTKIQTENQNNGNFEKHHLHELLVGSEIVYPKNEETVRSEELDKRCQLLQRQQENREYKAMTKNVDNVRKQHPEDTVSYQIKQINRQLIAVGQFIISVLAGFLFGFQGVELMVGSLDFGFRLLLGVICSLIIALAELYFLAKKLNEDLNFEVQIENKITHAKID